MRPQGPLYIDRMPPEQIAVVERRMRERNFSGARFLGRRESLTARVRADAAVLRGLGITHEQLARRLAAIVRAANRAAELRARNPEYQERMRQIMEEEDDARADELWSELNAVVVARRFSVVTVYFRGYQYCPFDYREHFTYEELPGIGRFVSGGSIESCGQTDCDVRVKNLDSGSSIHFSGLIIHLIREHQFFEGEGLQYRLDPKKAAETLGLVG